MVYGSTKWKKVNEEKLVIKNSVDDIIDSIFNELNINNLESISNKKFSNIKDDLDKIKNFILNNSNENSVLRRLDDNLNNNEDEIITQKINDNSGSIFGKVLNLSENTLHYIQNFDNNQYLNDYINNFNKSFNKFTKYVKKITVKI